MRLQANVGESRLALGGSRLAFGVRGLAFGVRRARFIRAMSLQGASLRWLGQISRAPESGGTSFPFYCYR